MLLNPFRPQSSIEIEAPTKDHDLISQAQCLLNPIQNRKLKFWIQGFHFILTSQKYPALGKKEPSIV